MKKFGLLCLSALLAACGAPEEQLPPEEVDVLYAETLKLTSIYTDSLRLAADSASVDAIFARFNSAYDSLNMSVSPNTDLLLEEDRNDTIVTKLNRLLAVRKRKLESLHIHLPDTLPPEAQSNK